MVDLIHRCQQGDPDAFEQLFREFYPKVLRTAFFITHSIQEAEDAAQETFLAVHKGSKDSGNRNVLPPGLSESLFGNH